MNCPGDIVNLYPILLIINVQIATINSDGKRDVMFVKTVDIQSVDNEAYRYHRLLESDQSQE